MQRRDLEHEPASLDVLADEFARDCRNGGCPSISRYVQRYPQLAAEIQELFPTIALMEQLTRREEATRQDARRLLAMEQRMLDRLGDYRIVREIGRGGMGIVYEAIQESLGRRVALKILTANVIRAPHLLERFQREARTVAMLHHTNIVPIFGVGHDDGLHYYVMQYIEGRNLDQLLPAPHNEHHTVSAPVDASQEARTGSSGGGGTAQAQLTWKQVAAYGAQIAQAVDYAHRQGVLHRDIKPANLLVDAQDTVWVTDFGLAKVFGADGLTRSGDLCGTLRYMAPEQFVGKSTLLSDVYSIGVTLFELATGQPAVTESDARQPLIGIALPGVRPPRQIDAGIPRDLETIILKAAAFDPRQRYSTAAELAADLERFRDGEPIAARRASWMRRAWHWSSRNPALAALSGISFLLLLLVAVVATIGWIRVDEARQRAVELAEREQRQASALRVAHGRAQQESEHARRESQRAEDNLHLAMRAFEDIIERVSGRDLPTSLEWDLDEELWGASPNIFTAQDADLLQSLLAFYEEFADRNHANDNVRLETAKAQHRIGDIRQSLGQYELALLAYEQALEIYQRMTNKNVPDAPLILATAAAFNQRGRTFLKTGQPRDALEAHLAAHDLLLQQPPELADTRACRFALAQTYNHLGAIWASWETAAAPPLARSGPVRLAVATLAVSRGSSPLEWMEANYQRAFELLESLIAEDPDNAQYRLALAHCYRNCLPLVRRGGSLEKTSQALLASVHLLEQLVHDFPDTPQFQFELADVLSIDASALHDCEFGRARRQRLERAEAIARHLNSSYPNQPEYKALYANALHRLGLIRYQQEQEEVALRHLSEAVGQYEELLDRFPAMPLYVFSLSRAANDLAGLQRATGQQAASRQTLENTILRLIATYDPQTDMRAASRAAAVLDSNLHRERDRRQP